MNQKKSYALPIAMMILLFGMISFVTNLAAPMGIVLKSQFGVSNFEGLLGNAANFIAFAVMGIPSGILLQRIGYKKTALIAIAVGFIGVGIQYLSGYAGQGSAFAVYLIGAFVAGFSMCLLGHWRSGKARSFRIVGNLTHLNLIGALAAVARL